MTKSTAAVIVRVRPAPAGTQPLPTESFQADFLSGYLGPGATQLESRAMLDPLVEKFTKKMESVVIFAYGQTGSGKTHSILGPPGSLTEHSVSTSSTVAGGGKAPSEWGMFPAIALETLASMTNTRSQSVLKCSVVEVYLDRVYDLLNGREQISIAGVGTKAVARGIVNCNRSTRDENGKWLNPFLARDIVQKRDREQQRSGRRSAVAAGDTNVTYHNISAPPDVARVSRLIEATRTAQSHNLNDRSSRSHCVVTLRSEAVNPATQRLEQASFTFADLAGSERVKASGVDADDFGRARSYCLKAGVSMDIPGSRFDEARNVNASLASLSRLMVAMSSKSSASGKGRHLPWRDSTLNLVLKESFTSSSSSNKYSSSPNIVLLMAVRENVEAEKETISTYRFGKVVANSGGTSLNRRRTQSTTTRSSGGRPTTSSSGASVGSTRSAKSSSAAVVDGTATATTGSLGETIQERIDRLTIERDALVANLDIMKVDVREAGGANPEKSANVQRDFLKNKKVLDDSKRQVCKLKERILEAKAKAKSATISPSAQVAVVPVSKANPTTVGVLQKDLQETNERVHIFQGLVARMINSGCYLPPSKKYTAMQKRLTAVNTELSAFSRL